MDTTSAEILTNELENQPEPRSILDQILDRMFEDLQSDQNFPMELVGRLQRLSIQQLTQAEPVRQVIERGVEGDDETD